MNHEQRVTREEAFNADLDRLKGVYATSLIDNVVANADFLLGLHDRWNIAMQAVGEHFGIDDTQDTPLALEQVTYDRLLSHERAQGRGTVLGFAGPGAAGKGTLAEQLGYPRVINTTTRLPRAYEVDGVHYHFLDEATFRQSEARGDFATVTDRPGRGLYATAKKDLALATSSQSGAAIIEENPATLTRLGEAIRTSLPDTNFVLTYILPPDPVQLNLALRLAGRCLVAGEDYRRAVESTLGQRQIDEFLSVREAENAGVPVLFVVNDSIERATGVIQSVVKATTSSQGSDQS
ncbi:MAG TPA: hypothetical protein VG935_00955 [Patescibacteria group bacterium]|nr:hypothetical protein [Patescibacteria group bacterium]